MTSAPEVPTSRSAPGVPTIVQPVGTGSVGTGSVGDGDGEFVGVGDGVGDGLGDGSGEGDGDIEGLGGGSDGPACAAR